MIPLATHSPLRQSAATLTLALTASFVHAQCERWIAGPDQVMPGTNGVVYTSTRWDPDGPGPGPELLVIGGDFTIAGGVFANNIAAWDGSSWRTFGAGLTDLYNFASVRALAVFNGELIAGGTFQIAGGSSTGPIARWDGSQWRRFTPGLSGGSSLPEVHSLMLHQGSLIVGGRFRQADGLILNNIARWDGTTWSSLGSGFSWFSDPLTVRAITEFNGELIVAGVLRNVGSPIRNIARWDGAAWQPLATGLGVSTGVNALAEFNGQLVAAGDIYLAGDARTQGVARWDGAAWTRMDQGIHPFSSPIVNALTVNDGELLAGGWVYFGGQSSRDLVMRWDGHAWLPLPTRLSGRYDEAVHSLTPFGDELLVLGEFSAAGDIAAPHIALWNGQSWRPIAANTNALCAPPLTFALYNGDLIAGGYFVGAGPAAALRIASWNGMSWAPLGAGVGTSYSDSTSVRSLMNHDSHLLAQGSFNSAGGIAVENIALWDGALWQPFIAALDDGTPVTPSAIVIFRGEVHAAAAGGVVRWDGLAWHRVGGAFDNAVTDLAVYRNELIAGGTFTSAGSVPAHRIARWNGSEWRSLGPGFDGWNFAVNALAVYDGDLFAAGLFNGTGGLNIARWDGALWRPVGAGIGVWQSNDSVQALVVHHGSLFATGRFATAGGIPASNIARWNEESWNALGSGLNATGLALHSHRGELIVGGSFTSAGGLGSTYWARWSDSAAPWIAHHTPSADTRPGGAFTLSIEPAVAYDSDAPLAFRWTRNNRPIADGPGGASTSGGTVSGASTSTLLVTNAQPSDAGRYRCFIANACGETQSERMTVTIRCPADFDGDGFITSQDLDAFLASFESGDGAADTNLDSFITGADFDFFLASFEAGC